MTYTIDIDSKSITFDGSSLDKSSIYPPRFYLDISSLTDGFIEEKLTLNTSELLLKNQSIEVQKLPVNNSEENTTNKIRSLLSSDNSQLIPNLQTTSSDTIQSAENTSVNIQATPITLIINTTADQNDGSADNGLSLRDAVIIANSDPIANEYKIVLTSGETYQLTAFNLSNDSDKGGDLDIYAKGQVTITTDGNQAATIDASRLTTRDRVIEVGIRKDLVVIATGNLILENTVITGGSDNSDFNGGGGVYIGSGSGGLLISVVVSDNFSSDGGGGIANRSTLLLLNSVVSNNRVAGSSFLGIGGGINNSGTLTILDSTIENNQSNEGGGGIANFEVATIINSTIHNNSSSNGGGIYNNDGTLGLTNVTVSSNTVTSYKGGGGLYNANASIATIVNSTITNNTATSLFSSLESGGGGIDNFGSTLNLRNTIVAGNTADNGADLRSGFGTNIVNDDGSNIIGQRLNGISSEYGTEIINNIDPKLGLLQDNGGPTFTHALLEGSAAIDAGNNANITADILDRDGDGDTTELIPFDQRGTGYPRIYGNAVDIGAFESSIDSAQYGASHADLITAFGYNLDALRQHYYNTGRFEGRRSDSFDEYRYTASNDDLIRAFSLNGAAATQHYIEHGYSENRSKTAFIPSRYILSYPDDLLGHFGTDTLAATRHFIEDGFPDDRRDPNLFDAARYIASSYVNGGDLIKAFRYDIESGSNHYLFQGRGENRSLTAFDPVAYLARNTDVLPDPLYGTPTGATRHYIEHGFSENRPVA